MSEWSYILQRASWDKVYADAISLTTRTKVEKIFIDPFLTAPGDYRICGQQSILANKVEPVGLWDLRPSFPACCRLPPVKLTGSQEVIDNEGLDPNTVIDLEVVKAKGGRSSDSLLNGVCYFGLVVLGFLVVAFRSRGRFHRRCHLPYENPYGIYAQPCFATATSGAVGGILHRTVEIEQAPAGSRQNSITAVSRQSSGTANTVSRRSNSFQRQRNELKGSELVRTRSLPNRSSQETGSSLSTTAGLQPDSRSHFMSISQGESSSKRSSRPALLLASLSPTRSQNESLDTEVDAGFNTPLKY